MADDVGDFNLSAYNMGRMGYRTPNIDEGAKVWFEPYTHLRQAILVNLRSDPFERAQDIGVGYELWSKERAFIKLAMGDVVGGYLQTFAAFPPRQRPGSFNVDRMMEDLYKSIDKKK